MSAERIDGATWAVAGTVVLGSVMSILDTTIVNVALETLAQRFDVSIPDVHWVASGYLLALAIVIPLAGWASERFGARRVWMSSVALFVAGSMLAGAAWSFESLVLLRVVQGLCGGMIVPVGLVILTRAAGPRRLGRVMSVIGIAQLLGPVLGPVLGGFLVEHGGWRLIFYVNVPIGALALALAVRHLPRDEPQPCDRLDVTGFAMLAAGLAALVYGLSAIANGGTGGGWPIAAGVALVAAFVLHARRAPNPLIDVRLLRRRTLAATTGTTFCLGMSLFGTLFLLPLYFQDVHGLSALDAGLMMAPQGVGAALALPIAGRVTDSYGPGRIVRPGLVLLLLGTLPFALDGGDGPGWLYVGALVVRGVGLGCSLTPAMAGGFASLDRSAVPRATSAVNALQRLGGSLGVALMSVALHQGMSVSAPDAFAEAFRWSIAVGALAFIPAAFLPSRPRAEAREPVQLPARDERAA